MKRSLIVIAAMVVSANAWSAGDAGCGLGSMIISKNSKGLQLLALTTNASFLSNFFGITTGTSNCNANGLVQREKEIRYYVESNHQDLSREIAAGEGEKVKTLASLYGCSTSADQNQFTSTLQSSYQALYPSAATTAGEFHANLDGVLRSNKTHVVGCSAI